MFWEESPKESGAVQICVVKVGKPIKCGLETQIPYLANTSAIRRLLEGVFIGFF
jgi:hypothetical protein